MKQIKEHSLLIILVLLVILASSSCKKQPVEKHTDNSIPYVPPVGKMAGTYKWYAGDSATADLVLTTHIVNCTYCGIWNGYDYYKANAELAPIVYYQFQQPYCIYPGQSALDSIQFTVNKPPYIIPAKVFKYVRI